MSITGDTGSAMAVLVYEWFALSKERQDELLKLRNDYENIWLNVIEELKEFGCNRNNYNPYEYSDKPQFRDEKVNWF